MHDDPLFNITVFVIVKLDFCSQFYPRLMSSYTRNTNNSFHSLTITHLSSLKHSTMTDAIFDLS